METRSSFTTSFLFLLLAVGFSSHIICYRCRLIRWRPVIGTWLLSHVENVFSQSRIPNLERKPDGCSVLYHPSN